MRAPASGYDSLTAKAGFTFHIKPHAEAWGKISITNIYFALPFMAGIYGI